MANTKSALKNARKTRARTIRNRPLKSKLKTLEKKFRASVEKENAEEATETAKANKLDGEKKELLDQFAAKKKGRQEAAARRGPPPLAHHARPGQTGYRTSMFSA